MRRVPSMALAAFAALNVFAAAAPAETPVDEQTVFMARFDAGPAAEIGADEVTGDGWTLVPGRFGQALRVEVGQTVAYPVEGLIDVEQGTIELWMQRCWDADEEVRSVLAGWRTPANNYVRINFVNAGRLGVAMNGGPEGATVWQRVDFDPTQWAAGSWHHVAAAWEGGAVRLYIDGERVGQVNNNSPMIEAPSRLEIGRGPVVIDDLRISSVARTDEEMLHAFTGRAPGEVTLLTDFEAFDAAQATGEVGVDTQRGIDDRTMPLMAGSRLYERGVGLRAPGRVSFEVPAGFGRLTGEVGACAFADTPGAEVAISVDGVEAFAAMVQPGGTPVAFDVTLPGACVVRIEARPGEASGGMALVGDPVLTPEGREPPEVLARQISEAAVEVQRMRMEATRFRFDLPAGEMAYVLYPGHPVDPIDPSHRPDEPLSGLSLQAAPGEFEAAQFALFAGADLSGVRVSCSDLTGDGGARIRASAVDVRPIRRELQRSHYRAARTPANFSPVSRFLFPSSDFWLPAGHFKEIHLIVEVPEAAAPGEYSGTVTVSADGVPATDVPLSVTVLPIRLIDHPHYAYSMYYNARNEARDRPERFRNELRNMREHGVKLLKPRGTGIAFEQNEDGEITWHLDDIRMVLEVLEAEGFSGPIPLADGAQRLGTLLGIRGITRDDDTDPLHESEEARRLMAEALAALEALNEQYPGFEFLTQHGDEVMGDVKRYPFIDHSKLVNPLTNLRNYMTVHMRPGVWEEPMAQIDEFIDVRCLNGHALEEWLRAGNSFEDLARIAEESGDELWIYHNMRGANYMPEWNRILHGVYMWQSPLRVHVPWMWNSFSGDPFDDTDAEVASFVYAISLDDRGEQIVSTLHWEACREGYDDMRYIATLEAAIAQARERGIDTADAERALDAAAAMLPTLPDEITQIEEESPLLVATAQRHTGADWDRMRARLAEAIIALERRL